MLQITNTATAKIISQALANRERIRKETDLRRFRGILETDFSVSVPQEEYLSFFKELQAAGYGQIIWGPRGAALRFLWRKNMRQVGESVLNQFSGTAPSPVAPVPVSPVEDAKKRARPFKLRGAKSNIEPSAETKSDVIPESIIKMVQASERKKTGLTLTEKVQFMLLLEKMFGL